MIAESIISLLPITISSISTAIRHHKQRSTGPKVFQSGSPRQSNITDDDYYEPQTDDDEDPEHEPPERLVPVSWVRIGLAGSGILGIVLVWLVFGVDGIHPWATAVGLVLASILSLIGVRALGETDINPVCLRCQQLRSVELMARYRVLVRSVNCYSQSCNRVMSWPTSLLAEWQKQEHNSESNRLTDTCYRRRVTNRD